MKEKAKKKNVKRLLSLALAFIVALTFMPVASLDVYAGTNGAQMSGMTEAMHTPEYWANASAATSGIGVNTVLMSTKKIAEINKRALQAEAAKMNDLANFKTSFDATKIKESLAGEAVPKTQYYVKKQPIDNATYFGSIAKDIERTGYTGTRDVQYAVCTSHADIKAYPTNDIIMDSLTDTADEIQSSSMLLNEPFIIMQKCDREGTTFYWGYADNVSGWVDGANLAICSSRAEWLDAWQITNLDAKDFLVVTQNRIILEPSTDDSYPANLHLGMGTRLKLVSEKDVPETVGERGTLANYVVYVPARDASGHYIKKMALIGINNSVNIGYLPYTQANVMKLAYACEGDRYGWGNMFERLDCSGYARNILRCFGFDFPRNTTWQREIPGTQVNTAGLTNAEKMALLETLPAGTLLYISGHAMVYTGIAGGMPYAISAAGSFALPQGELKVVKYLSVVTTPLSVRRANGTTWLDNIQTAVVTQDRTNIAGMKFTATKKNGQADSQAKLVLKSGEQTLRQGTDYKVVFQAGDGLSGKVTAIGIGQYFGVLKTDIEIEGYIGGFLDVPTGAYYAQGVKACLDRGLMKGTSEKYFSPASPLTLAQVETILARMDGGDATKSWEAAYAKYGDAVATRAQAASMLYQHSQVQAGVTAEDAVDAGAAMAWAVEKGLIKGDETGNLNENGQLTRGQFATIIERYISM